MKKSILSIAFGGLLAVTQAWAVNTLQLGVPGATPGTYVTNTTSSTIPTEDDTVITSGNTLLVAGSWKLPDTLGGQSLGGDDWSTFTNKLSVFDDKGAILVVSVPNNTLTLLTSLQLASIQVGGVSAFVSDADNSHLTNNANDASGHDPAKGSISDFLFFDIGNFSNASHTVNGVPNFQSSPLDFGDGLIKELTLSGFGSLAWAHFDVMALETTIDRDKDGNIILDKDGNIKKVTTVVQNNPFSHDVTWKPGDPPCTDCNPVTIPEPTTLLLMSAGLFGFGFARRRRSA
ncbi:choice-of-anchor N protein [Candidatus Nitrotoga sp. 1052]|uniref:choice-of-anchor N protein n=1 Tax=Candidatus Nitrotoga sp. 1052 TaxID=2886964 RepID=UPI001EF491DD|nr:choice-of-anchor N protein [Candidatus Nitrotoga sp. 1052]CAH1083223.1 putative secreted protein [Candidatus Nitrotoga sp. 1052]